MTVDSPGLAGLGSMGARQWCIVTTPRRHIRAAEVVERRRDQELAEKPEVHETKMDRGVGISGELLPLELNRARRIHGHDL